MTGLEVLTRVGTSYGFPRRGSVYHVHSTADINGMIPLDECFQETRCYILLLVLT